MKAATKHSPRNPVRVTWLGHSAFKLETARGTVMLIDPWLDNPKAPAGVKDLPRVDCICVTHGHSDHIGNTIDIARATNARVIAIYEIAEYFRKAGLARVEGINKSGTAEFEGVHVTMVQACHSSGFEPGGAILVGGDPAGYVIRFDDGATVYHAGDTGLFGDMQLIGELYRPDLAILPIGGYFTMGPVEAARACELLKPKYILGMHYGTFPLLAGTPAELRIHLSPALKKRVYELQPGETLTLN